MGVAYDHVTTFEISAKPHISGTVEARIMKFCLHSESNVFGKKLIFIPQSGRGLQSRDHFENLEKFNG